MCLSCESSVSFSAPHRLIDGYVYPSIYPHAIHPSPIHPSIHPLSIRHPSSIHLFSHLTIHPSPIWHSFTESMLVSTHHQTCTPPDGTPDSLRLPWVYRPKQASVGNRGEQMDEVKSSALGGLAGAPNPGS